MYLRKNGAMTSNLEESIAALLREKIPPEYVIYRHSHPDWCYSTIVTRHVELDIYIPQLFVAIEVQGLQHDKLIEYFQSDQQFWYTQAVDRQKSLACEYVGVELFRVYTMDEATDVINNIIIDDIIPFVTDPEWIKEKEKRMFMGSRLMISYLRYMYAEDELSGKRDYYCSECNRIGTHDEMEVHVRRYHKGMLSLIRNIKETPGRSGQLHFMVKMQNEINRQVEPLNLSYHLQVELKNGYSKEDKKYDKYLVESGIMPPKNKGKRTIGSIQPFANQLDNLDEISV